MKKLICLLLGLFFLFGAINLTWAENNNVESPKSKIEIIEEELNKAEDDLNFNAIKKHAVPILSIGSGGTFGKCSGVLIEENEDQSGILTAKHCVDIPEEIYVGNNSVVSVQLSVNDDLAYLTVEGDFDNKEPVTIAKYGAVPGDTVYLVGYPKWKSYEEKEEPYKSSGVMIIRTNDWDLANYASIGGTSGGGIYNEDAELVGIHWGGFLWEDTSIYEPICDVKRFLKRIGKIK